MGAEVPGAQGALWFPTFQAEGRLPCTWTPLGSPCTLLKESETPAFHGKSQNKTSKMPFCLRTKFTWATSLAWCRPQINSWHLIEWRIVSGLWENRWQGHVHASPRRLPTPAGT